MIVRESIHNILKESNCSLCGCNEKKLLGSAEDYYNNFPGEFTFYKCNCCGFVYTNPRPTQEHISKLYPDEAGYLTPKEVLEVPKKSKRCLNIYFDYAPSSMVKKVLLYPFYAIRIRKLKIQSFPNYVKGGSLLDIGASYGDYLYKMKSLGWNTKGIELNQNSVNYATNQLKLDVENILIEDYYSKTKYKVITMGMVMEHILYPNEVLKKVHSLLDSKGMFIFSIPNFAGFEAKIFGKYWYSLHLPMHLNHFTPKTVKQLLEKNGFNDIKIYHQNDYNDLIRSLEYISKNNKLLKIIHQLINTKLIRKLIIAPLIFILSLFGITSRMTVYCKKQS